MLYCPRCNNTHWTPAEMKGMRPLLAVLTLQRPYSCLKCGKITLGSVFLERRSLNRDKSPKVDCPRCGSATHRSRRQSVERLIPWLKAYRCSNCNSRFRRLSRA
jgi:DNA-directed RNA polymerase subunit RPC12/RpoP